MVGGLRRNFRYVPLWGLAFLVAFLPAAAAHSDQTLGRDGSTCKDPNEPGCRDWVGRDLQQVVRQLDDTIYGPDQPAHVEAAILKKSKEDPTIASQSVADRSWEARLSPATTVVVTTGLLALAAFFFTRLQKSSVLDHPGRRLLVELVQSNPGIQVAEAARLAGLPYGTIRHHVRVLSNLGLLVVRRFGHSRTLFLPGQLSWRDQAKHHQLNKEAVKQLLCTLRNDPDLTQNQVAQRLGWTQQYVSKLMTTLRREGLVEWDQVGSHRVYRATCNGSPEAFLPSQ